MAAKAVHHGNRSFPSRQEGPAALRGGVPGAGGLWPGVPGRSVPVRQGSSFKGDGTPDPGRHPGGPSSGFGMAPEGTRAFRRGARGDLCWRMPDAARCRGAEEGRQARTKVRRALCRSPGGAGPATLGCACRQMVSPLMRHGAGADAGFFRATGSPCVRLGRGCRIGVAVAVSGRGPPGAQVTPGAAPGRRQSDAQGRRADRPVPSVRDSRTGPDGSLEGRGRAVAGQPFVTATSPPSVARGRAVLSGAPSGHARCRPASTAPDCRGKRKPQPQRRSRVVGSGGRGRTRLRSPVRKAV